MVTKQRNGLEIRADTMKAVLETAELTFSVNQKITLWRLLAWIRKRPKRRLEKTCQAVLSWLDERPHTRVNADSWAREVLLKPFDVTARIFAEAIYARTDAHLRPPLIDGIKVVTFPTPLPVAPIIPATPTPSNDGQGLLFAL